MERVKTRCAFPRVGDQTVAETLSQKEETENACSGIRTRDLCVSALDGAVYLSAFSPVTVNEIRMQWQLSC
jgi:hypothetical protein